MKTIDEKINAVRDMINSVAATNTKLKGQKAFIDAFLQISNVKQTGVETQVRYEVSTMWSDRVSFPEGAICYHIDNYIKIVFEILDRQLRMVPADFQGWLAANTDNLSYEFDSFVIKLQQIMEEPIFANSKSAKSQNEKCRNFAQRNIFAVAHE